ncbi:hypothetical protein [Streptomyces sp. NPDC004376]
MPPYTCSLKVEGSQRIQPGTWSIVRFPYTSESADDHDMHPARQPGGRTVTGWATDNRAGLIWPAEEGWGELHAMIQWEAGGYTELRDQFVRDPLGYTTDPANTTATDHRPPSPGMQSFTKSHGIYVHPGTPLALRVWHNDKVPRLLTLAEFKLVIHT